MRLRDTPTVEVARTLPCSPEHVWALVTDIELPTRADGELQRVEWLDGASGVSVGAQFRGHNQSDQTGQWHTEPEVVEVEDGRRWVWCVGPVEAPIALWGFEVDPAEDGALVRQWAKMCLGRSPLSDRLTQPLPRPWQTDTPVGTDVSVCGARDYLRSKISTGKIPVQAGIGRPSFFARATARRSE